VVTGAARPAMLGRMIRVVLAFAVLAGVDLQVVRAGGA
jgi:hypothetical protein